MNIFAWDAVSLTYLMVFLGVIAGLIALFALAPTLAAWHTRRRVEKEIARIEAQRNLTDEEADFLVYISNKNQLNLPTTLYTSLRVFDTLLGREIEMLMDSAAPLETKRSTVDLVYNARAKLFPWTLRLPRPPALGVSADGASGAPLEQEGVS